MLGLSFDTSPVLDAFDSTVCRKQLNIVVLILLANIGVAFMTRIWFRGILSYDYSKEHQNRILN